MLVAVSQVVATDGPGSSVPFFWAREKGNLGLVIIVGICSS